ncbi:MAG TPA: ABC transporter permease [Anaerolineae bacterium]|nr:ABC transporter permease [Anaerolineae bacterium]
MLSSWHQLAGIAWYEMRLQWRRRSILVLIVTFLVLIVGAALTMNADPNVDVFTDSAELSTQGSTFLVLLMFGPSGLLTIMLTLPPITAETIPKDHQYRVDELIAATPCSPAIYLLGKLIGVLITIVAVMLLAAIGQWGLTMWLLANVEFWPFVRMWLLGIAPAAFILTTSTILLASTQTTRRRAVLVGGLITLTSVLTIPFGMNGTGTSWLHTLNPSIWIRVMLHQLFSYVADAGGDTSSFDHFFLPAEFFTQLFITNTGLLIILSLAVWAWWRFVRYR